ncbi:MAG: 23S rRNA (pseudouridine(1915)-N(3))-methyltransferase RlmH [Sphingomonadaceae bacterium]
MRITILAHGKGGDGEEQALARKYLKRLPVPAELVEVKAFAPARPGQVTVVLDEGGQSLSSAQLAAQLRAWRDSGVREARFLIGPADGHDAQTLAQADLVLAFGPATWPHLLVRAMLAEQLFRAFSILSGHPYHRA